MFAQQAVVEKTNEITAIPDLLSLLAWPAGDEDRNLIPEQIPKFVDCRNRLQAKI